MNIHNLIKTILAPTNIPSSLLTYTGTATTYITFFEYNQRGSLYLEDDEATTTHSIQVDVWSKGNYLTLVDQVKSLMKQAGFTRNSEAEFFEEDTKIFHKVLRFYYEENL